MRDFNIAFYAALRSRHVEFRYTLEIAFDAAGTDLVYFTSHADAGYPGGATVVENSIASISAVSQKLDNRYARAQIGGLTFVVGDYSGTTRAILNAKLAGGASVRRRKVVIYAGFKGLDWVDYEPIDTFYIDTVSNTGSGWQFSCTDVQKEARTKIFVLDETTLTKSITADQLHIPVTLASTAGKFETVEHDANYSDRPNETVGYIRIDDEVVAHAGFITHGTDGTSFDVVERGALNSAAVPHESDENASTDRRKKVTEYVYLEGAVPEILHLILTGTSIDGNRTIPDNWHAGIDASLVNTDSFEGIGIDLYNPADGAGRMCRFTGEKDQDAKQFDEQQLMRWSSLYQVIDSQGAIHLRRYQPRLSQAAAVMELGNDNVKVGDLLYDGDSIVNVINILWNWNDYQERTTRTTTLIDADSITKHNQIFPETFEFRGVHTGIHADTDIRNWFDAFRDLYANPPYRLPATGDHGLLPLEVGDAVRVDTHMLGDLVNDTDLDRTFEITQRRIDFKTGKVSLELIGSSQPAAAVLAPAAEGSASQLDAGWYTGTGTDLDSLANISSGATTGNVNLTGNADANHANAIYYHDGDLTVTAGHTITCTQNVQLRINGFLTINGAISSKGQGHAGQVGNFATEDGNYGTPGYLGTTFPGPGVQVVAGSAAGKHRVQDRWFYTNSAVGVGPVKAVPIAGKVESLPAYSLINRDGNLEGLPSDLRGTSGSAGLKSGDFTTPQADGGDGGAGGGGLIIICKGMSFGASGEIDTSGADGTAGAAADLTLNSVTGRYFGGAGAGGAPGGLLVVIDGDNTPPSLTSNHVGNLGDSPAQGTSTQETQLGAFLEPIPSPGGRSSYGGYGAAGNGRGFAGRSYGEAAHRLQYVPLQEGVEDDGTSVAIRTLAQVTGVSVASGTTHMIIHNNGSVSERALVTWSAVNDEAVTGYQMQAKRTADSDWITQAITEGPDDLSAYFDVQDGTQYDVRVRAFGDNVIPGDWSATEQHTATGASALTAIAAPANVAADSGTDQLLELSDGTIVERILVTWNASADPLWTGTEIEFKKSSDSNWQDAALINSANVLRAYIIGEGGTNYDIRLRHLSRTRPNSAYTTVSAHTLVGETAPPSDVTNFRVSQNGELVNFFHDLISDADRDGYLYRYGPVDVTWENAIPLNTESKGTAVSAAYVPPGTWDFLCKAIDRSKNVSENAARASLTVTTAYNVISEVQHDPGWKNGTVDGYWVHYTGVLVPLDQDEAFDYGFEMFDEVVPNPVAESSFTSDEQDGLVEAIMRIWADVDSVLVEGETGIANPQLSVDYKTEAGSYDGFEDWNIGQVVARYAKFKITNDNTQGPAIIQGLKTVLDAQERTEKAQGVTVAPGGTPITFDTEFRETPFIRVFTQAGSGLIPDSAGDSSTGFTFHLYNSAGSSVGGTGKWEAEGI